MDGADKRTTGKRNDGNSILCSAFYSMISTAQANGLDVEKYLTDLFSNPTGTILLPWND